MKYLPLVWRNLFGRRRTRTVFTVLSVMVAFVLYGVLIDDPDGVQHGRGRRRRGPPDADAQGVHHHAAADQLPGAHPRREGRGRRHARHLVRRLLPGPEELLRPDGRRPRAVAAAAPRVRAAGGPAEGLARRPHRRHRRPPDGRPLRLEGRRPDPDPGDDLPAEERRARPGRSRSTASTTATSRAWTRRSSSSATTTSTRRGSGAGAWSAGTWSA